MKHLILMRHAKSSWNHPDLEDHERPLNTRGKEAAKAMAGWLSNLNAIPNYAIVSDARRTEETWELLSADMGINPETHISRDLYLATPIAMLNAIKGAPEAADCAIVVGHQPGMSVLIERLSDGSEPLSRNRAYQHFPTASTALIDVPVARWEDVDFGRGVFKRFASPKELQNA